MKTTLQKIFASVAAATAFALPQVALAADGDTGSLKMTSYAYPSALGFAVTGHSSVGAGGFNASYDRNFNAPPAATSFVAYCIDLAETFSWNSAFTVTEKAPSSLFGGFKAGALDRLYTQHFKEVGQAPTATDRAVKSAAFQLAVWEIVTETQPTATYAAFDLGSGSFRVTSGNSTARTTADTWLDNLGTGQSGAYTLTALYSNGHQDQMMATPVPEPETYMMLLAGLGLMGFVARRRQRQIAVA